jgi:NAD(P)-dependent dehydrogenase (short-subunit alcohol dehydrogenase family)
MPLDPSRALLTDRVAVVTGAAVGIGAAVALAFARFGAHLALCDRDAPSLDDTAQAARALGRRVETAVLDVRDAPAVAAFLARVGEVFGRIDALVNNAGGTFRSDFLDVSERGEEALVRENFTSVGHFVRGAVPRMPERGGSIVNVTSIEAHRAGPGYAIYSAMKAAVESLTKSLALELGHRRIRVNCIAPDRIPTPGLGRLTGAPPPLGHDGDPDDVAGAAVFLVSDLSRFVTGATLHVDGGGLAAGGWRRAPGGGFET